MRQIRVVSLATLAFALMSCTLPAPTAPSLSASPEPPTAFSAQDVGVIDNVGVVESADAVRTVDITSPVTGELYVPAIPSAPLPGVVMLHGSEGYTGPTRELARHLAAQGFVTLALCYFGCPGQPSELRRVPLEYALSAIETLRSRPEVDAASVSVWGASRGGELALLIGSYSSNLRSVIALYGSPWAVGGFGSVEARSDCAWTLNHGCVSAMTRIPVERIHGPVLLMVGQYDAVWPMAYSEQVSAELEAAQHPHQLLVFPDVGHAFGTVPCLIGVRTCRVLENWSTMPANAQAYVAASRAAFVQTLGLLRSSPSRTMLEPPIVLPEPVDLPTPANNLLADPLTDPSIGALPGTSDEPGRYSRGYATGEYAIRLTAVGDGSINRARAPIPGAFGDASVEVTARLLNPTVDQYIDLGCRANGDSAQYRLMLYPVTGMFQLGRTVASNALTLTGVQPSSHIHMGSALNEIELSCRGPVIQVSINGATAARVTDYSITQGQMWIGVGQSTSPVAPGPRIPPGGSIEARFTNLVVR